MWVKIGETWHDSNEQPIMIQLSEGEQEQIANIDREVAPKGRYALYPIEAFNSHEELMEWICDGRDE